MHNPYILFKGHYKKVKNLTHSFELLQNDF